MEGSVLAKKKRVYIFLFVLCLVLSLGSARLLSMIYSSERMTVENTVPYEATVTSIEMIETANGGREVWIYTKEYSNAFRISARFCKRLGTDKALTIKKGEEVNLRIGSLDAEQSLNTAVFVDIVALKTDSTDVITMDEYNAIMHSTSASAKSASVMMIGVFAALSIFFFLRSKKMRK